MALPTQSSVLSSIANFPTVFYQKVAEETLINQLFLYGTLDLRPLPQNVGATMQIFAYDAMVADTTPKTEGSPVAGVALTAQTRSIALSQYADWVTLSDKVQLMNIDNTLAAAAKQLAYQGALSIDQVVQAAYEAASTAAENIDIATGSHVNAGIVREAAASLRSSNVRPKDNGNFMMVAPSVHVYDIVNDNTAGGFIDLQKYSDKLAQMNLEGVKNGYVGMVGGVDIYESNSLTSTTDANWQTGGKTAYHSFVVGSSAMFGASLGKTELGRRNFAVKTAVFEPGSNALDPAGLIRSAVAYNAFFGVAKRPGTTQGFRRIRAEATLG